MANPPRVARTFPTVLLASAVFPGAAVHAVPVQEVVVEPCRKACALTLAPAGELGDDAGPGMLESGYTRIHLDSSGRRYATSYFSTDIKVYGPDGAFLNRIGRKGQGPGEFEGISALAFADDGVVTAFDHTGTIQTFDWTGDLLNFARLPFRPGRTVVPMDGPWVVLQADVRTPERVGLPLHLVNVDDGAVGESFGSITGEYRPDEVDRGLRVIAPGPHGHVWSAFQRRYRIELWSPDGLANTLVRTPEWFPPVTAETASHGPNERPNPVLANMVAAGSRLWVKVLVADERWADAYDGAGSVEDPDLFQDTVVEVIDWEAGKVLASHRFDDYYDGLVAPGLIGKTVITPTGSVQYRMFRLEMEGES